MMIHHHLLRSDTVAIVVDEHWMGKLSLVLLGG